MLKFITLDRKEAIIDNEKLTVVPVLQVEPKIERIALFLKTELSGDVMEFLNEKYLDKSINMEWGKIDREARVKYHETEIERHKKQLELLKSGKDLVWNENGNGVE